MKEEIAKRIKNNSVIYGICKGVYHIFRSIFSRYGYIRNYIVFPIKAFFRTKRICVCSKKYEKLEEMKNKYEGKRGFIIATGPSLRWEDLDKLAGELTFGLNSLYRGYNKSSFRPDFYFIGDKDVFIDFDKTNYCLSELAKQNVFLNDMIKRDGDNIVPVPINYLDHWFNYGNKKYDFYKNLKFSDDILWGIYDKWTSTICLIEIAMYMGCKEIYLLGVDCNYSLKNLHFEATEYENLKSAPNKNLDVASIQQKSNFIGYEYIKNEAEKRNVKIYNATRGGSLDVFERVNFDDIISF